MVPPSHGHTAHAAVLLTHLERYQLFQQFLPIVHVSDLIDEDTEGGDEGSAVLPGDEDIAMQTLFVDELGNLLNTVEFRGLTTAYTQKCGMGVHFFQEVFQISPGGVPAQSRHP